MMPKFFPLVLILVAYHGNKASSDATTEVVTQGPDGTTGGAEGTAPPSDGSTADAGTVMPSVTTAETGTAGPSVTAAGDGTTGEAGTAGPSVTGAGDGTTAEASGTAEAGTAGPSATAEAGTAGPSVTAKTGTAGPSVTGADEGGTTAQPSNGKSKGVMKAVGACGGASGQIAFAANPLCPQTCKTTLENVTGIPASEMACDCKTSCSRRLNGKNIDVPARQLAAQGTLSMDFIITVPPGKDADTVTNTIKATPKEKLTTVMKDTLQQAGGAFANMDVDVQEVTAQAIAPGARAGYEKCFEKQACYFKGYSDTTHYKLHKKTANYPRDSCAADCLNDPKCEAFESLGAGMKPSCSFWMNGACDIMKGNPPGFVKDIPYATSATEMVLVTSLPQLQVKVLKAVCVPPL